MRTWVRAPEQKLCGRCGTHVVKAAPIVRIVLPGVKRERWRGECCEGKCPVDLPELVEAANTITPVPKASTSARQPLFASVGEIAGSLKHRGDFRRMVRSSFDARAAAANDREPGEEG